MITRTHGLYAVLAALAASCLLTESRLALAQGKPETQTGDAQRAIIVLDASGSMWGQVEGKAKIEVAREVIAKLLRSLPANLELGLMAYGHRREGDCQDIELLIKPGSVDRGKFLDKVESIVPKGKTPLTSAVEQAAKALAYTENPASVILVSDGLENCNRDPCELAETLKRQGVAFRAHVVAFDVASKEADTFRCLADVTGGQFLPAQNAASLADALELAVEEAAKPPIPADAPKPPPPVVSEATLEAPDKVPAGSVFEVKWQGPGNSGDWITVIEPDAKPRQYGNYAYTRRGNPVELTAPIQPGNYQVRYVVGTAGQVAGTRPIEVTPVQATLKAPAEAVAGSFVEVEFTGPANRGDYLTIVEGGAKDGVYRHYAYAMHGSPAKVRATTEPGAAEIRYATGQGGLILARAPLRILPAEATVAAPLEAPGGSPIEVTWTGPKGQGDFITIVPKGAKDSAYGIYKYARERDNPAELTVPPDAGEYEVRYVAAPGSRVLASQIVKVVEATATVSGPEQAVAGSLVEVEWTGPKGQNDFLSIVPKGQPDKTYGQTEYARRGSPVELEAPETAGEAEIRYYTGRDRKVIGRASIMITARSATLEAPAEIKPGARVEIKWNGPNNPHDVICIVPADAKATQVNNYVYAARGSPQSIAAPKAPGQYEIRYVAGRSRAILARQPVKILGGE